MSAGDLVLFLGFLVSAWSLGFAGGYTMTKFREAFRTLG